MVDFHEELCGILGDASVKTKEDMSRHTTFRVGGPAEYFAVCEDVDRLRGVIALCSRENMPYYILGNGSNLLVGDGGYDGVIISMSGAWNRCVISGDRVTAGAGISLPKLARCVLPSSLSGLEFAAGIPGSVGGAVVMNAGAYGSEMKRVITGVKVMDPDGQVKRLSAEELELGYRTSCILKNRYIVLEAELQLVPGIQEEIKALMDDYMERRRSKQPLEYPSAGSTFKRPEGYFAGKLIEDAGLRGYRVGGAQVSEKHCGFVINRENATAADIIRLCGDVAGQVKEKFGVELHMEVKKLGNFSE